MALKASLLGSGEVGEKKGGRGREKRRGRKWINRTKVRRFESFFLTGPA